MPLSASDGGVEVWPLLERKLDQNVIQEVFMKVCLDGAMPRYQQSSAVSPSGVASNMGFQRSDITPEISTITDAVESTKTKEDADYAEAHAINEKR